MKVTRGVSDGLPGAVERPGSPRSNGGDPVTAPAAAPRPAARPAPRPPIPGMGGLGGADAPPIRLPAEHFAAAVAFFVAGALGLVWVAPDLAQGFFPLPRVVAVTHLFTLGWITTTILGALYQFLPVALRVPIRSVRLGHVTWGMYVPGLVLFVTGLLSARTGWVVAGAALFASALLLFVGNLVATLMRAPERNLTWWALWGASLYLVVTVALGASLAGNLRWGYLGADRFLAVGVHLHLAIAGWVMLVVVGVAHRLLPMFLLSHGAPEWPGRVAAASIAAGAGLLLATHHALSTPVLVAVAILLIGGMVAFIGQAALYLRHRKKPALDPGLRLAGIGVGFMGVAVTLAPFFLARGLSAPTVMTAYGIALVLGGISLFVAGMFYKIVPFLAWFHRFGGRVGKGPVPRVADLFSARIAGAVGAALGLGVAGLVLSALAGYVPAARPAAALFAAGAITLAAQMIAIARRRGA